MRESHQAALQGVRAWFAEAAARGWLAPQDTAALEQLERGTPRDLFEGERERPLVVAFFGGTGVGKSSLLNRLAGEHLARTGVERPTSHEVTVYVHADVEPARLPEGFAAERVNIARHTDAGRRGVMWIDTPDIDSATAENRGLAMAWLPHVDLVVYVVSPERYRDDAGWRILRARQARHGWVFVLNRWDEGDPRQAADFAAILRDAGFVEPLVLRTVATARAAANPVADDEFEQLESWISRLVAEHGLRELERSGQLARLRELADALRSGIAKLGAEAAWGTAAARWRDTWNETAAAIADGSTYAIDLLASALGQRSEAFWSRTVKGALRTVAEAGGAARQGGAPEPATVGGPRPDTGLERSPATPSEGALISELDRAAAGLWDDWARGKANAAAERFEVLMGRAGGPAAPVRAGLRRAMDSAEPVVGQAIQEALRAALGRGGNAWRRAARRCTGFLMTALPAAALCWIAWHVVIGFQSGTSGQAAFFGTNFLIHSALLVAVAWGAPFALDLLLRPNLVATGKTALRSGLRAGLDELGERCAAELAALAVERAELARRGAAQIEQLTRAAAADGPAAGTVARRVLSGPDAGSTSGRTDAAVVRG